MPYGGVITPSIFSQILAKFQPLITWSHTLTLHGIWHNVIMNRVITALDLDCIYKFFGFPYICSIFIHSHRKLTALYVYRNNLPHLCLTPAWISNHKPSKMGDAIINPFSNFNGCTTEVYEWISDLIPHFSRVFDQYCCALSSQIFKKSD